MRETQRVHPIFLIITLLLIAAPLAGQSGLPRAAILLQPEDREDTTMMSLSATIGATLQLSLSLVGEFSMLPLQWEATADPVELAARRGADLVFVVTLNSGDSGGYELTSDVYNSLEDVYQSVATEEAESLFDVFDAADRLTVGLVQAVSAADVSFGSLRLVNEGFEGEYEVRIDGVPAGAGITGIDRLPTGDRTVSILPPGESQSEPFFVQTISVEEGERAEITFALPFLPPEAQKQLDENHLTSLTTFIGGETTATEAPAELPERPLIQEQRNRLTQLLSESRVTGETFSITTPARYRRLVNSLTTTREVPGRRFIDGIPEDWVIAHSVPLHREINLDGEADEWADVEPIRVDPPAANDPDSSRPGDVEWGELSGTDFAQLRLAETEEGLYFLLTFHDGAPQEVGIKYRLSFYSPNHESGDSGDLMEISWTHEGDGEQPDQLRRAMSGDNDWRELSSRPADTRTTVNGFEGFFPRGVYEPVREHGGMNGWEINARAELIREGELLITDEISWASEVYF